jgi:hypothetical protein
MYEQELAMTKVSAKTSGGARSGDNDANARQQREKKQKEEPGDTGFEQRVNSINPDRCRSLLGSRTGAAPMVRLRFLANVARPMPRSLFGERRLACGSGAGVVFTFAAAVSIAGRYLAVWARSTPRLLALPVGLLCHWISWPAWAFADLCFRIDRSQHAARTPSRAFT